MLETATSMLLYSPPTISILYLRLKSERSSDFVLLVLEKPLDVGIAANVDKHNGRLDDSRNKNCVGQAGYWDRSPNTNSTRKVGVRWLHA